MMATTHVLAAMALAAVVAPVAPAFAPVALVAAAAGGLFPDLDLYAGHRRTLHYPVYSPVAAAVALGLAVAMPAVATVAAAAFLAGVALHSAMDVLGGGLELRPWLGTSERAVYSHFHGRWIAPRRLVRYDGAPEDLGLAVLLGLPTLLAFGEPVDGVVIAVLALSAGYALVRKPLVWIAERLVGALPGRVVGYLPERFSEPASGSR